MIRVLGRRLNHLVKLPLDTLQEVWIVGAELFFLIGEFRLGAPRRICVTL